MSKHETWRTRLFWQEVGGLLIEEFAAVRRNKHQGQRLIDGVIICNEPKGIHKGSKYDVKGKDVIVVQTKKARIGMNLLGQTYFSSLLLKRLGARVVRTVAICGERDAVMVELAAEHGIEVVVIEDGENPMKYPFLEETTRG